MNKTVLLILFSSIAFHCSAQGKLVLDSLHHITKTSKNDRERIHAYAELAMIYQPERTTALLYSDSAWRIASVTREDRAGMQCHTACLYAGLYRSYGDSADYQRKIKEAIVFAKEAGDEKYMGLVYHQQALFAYYTGNTKGALALFLQSIDLLENSTYQHVCVTQYYLVSSIFERLADYDACLMYAKKARKHSTSVNDICRTNHNIANAYFHFADSDPNKAMYVDSSLFLLYQVRNTLEKKRDQIRQPVLYVKVYNDLANIYMRIKSKYDDDSAMYYLNLARNASLDMQNKLGYAAMSVLLSHYYVEDNDIARASTLLIEAKKAYQESPLQDLAVEGNISMGFAKLNEKKGSLKEALENYRRFFELKDSIYRIESLDAVKRAEAKFAQEKKQRQIELLKEEEAGRRQTLYFSAGVTVAMVVLLLMLYRSTLFRKKFYNEKEKLLTQQAATIKLQKEEVEQTLQLQKKASERLALEHQLEVSQRDQYQRELVTGVHYLESKNDLLLKLKEAVTGMPPGQGEEHTEAVVAQMLKLIDDNLDADNDFDRFSRNFEYVYPNFFKRLEERSGDTLSQLDLRYCAYIYMGLSTKEMSNLLNVDPASIRTARYRLKQKFDLGKEEDLVAFINNNFSA
jgi:DNA-binding CsgD family transcriptional regulator